MKKFFIKSVLLFLFAVLSVPCFSIDVDIPDELQDDRNLPREERIKRHQKRVQLILEARKKQREEEKRRRLEEEKGRREEAVQKKKESPAKPPGEPSGMISIPTTASQAFAHTILHFYPFDKTVILGKNFLTDMELFNLHRKPIKGMRVKITFDPRFIVPVYVNDHEIKDLLMDAPYYEVNMEEGNIVYDCRFKEPQPLDGLNLLRIVWNPIRVTDHCEISFDLSENNTAIFSEEKDILGIPQSDSDGIIPTGITILSESRKNSAKIQVDADLQKLIGKKIPGTQSGDVTLKLRPEKKTVTIGEEFDVDILLSNPEAEIIDNLSLLIRYDPAKLKVVDQDKRNWINQGVNIHDGFARKKFPFDYHIRNEAHNQQGYIEYRMGSSLQNPPPSGAFARIRFEALAPADNTIIYFDRTDSRRYPDTVVTYLGENLLSPEQWTNRELALTSVRINVP